MLCPRPASGSQPSPDYPLIVWRFLVLFLIPFPRQGSFGTQHEFMLETVLLENIKCQVNQTQRLTASGMSRAVNNAHFPHERNWGRMYPKLSLMWTPVSSEVLSFQAQQPTSAIIWGRFVLAPAT